VLLTFFSLVEHMTIAIGQSSDTPRNFRWCGSLVLTGMRDRGSVRAAEFVCALCGISMLASFGLVRVRLLLVRCLV
jgi:hypothetical protein